METVYRDRNSGSLTLSRPQVGNNVGSIPLFETFSQRDRSETVTQLSLNLCNATGTLILRMIVIQRLNADDLDGVVIQSRHRLDTCSQLEMGVDICPLTLSKKTTTVEVVWADFMADGHSDLHVSDRGTLTDQRYWDEILASYSRLFRRTYGPNLICLDDNAPTQKAQFGGPPIGGYERMKCLVLSSDLNSFEYVWDVFGRSITAPITFKELERALLHE
ncbi:transposable element Tcb2 transposase [Trichonephila clavipes]|nr:transposable element Tcb2 transposase [Trichonephila clavipes]